MVSYFTSPQRSALILLASEFAEYTSAQERIALGKKSRKVEANKRRDVMKELIADAYVKLQPFRVPTNIFLYLGKRKMKRQLNGNKNNFAEADIELQRDH